MDTRTAELRTLARARIEAGQLLQSCHHAVFGGRGDGQQICGCCGKTITFTQVQYDVECECPVKRIEPVSMHLDCYDAWRTESGSQVVSR